MIILATSWVLLQEIVKLFLIMCMGFALIKSGHLKSSDGRSLSVLLVYLIIPCVIIHSFQIDAADEVKQGLVFAFGAAVFVHIFFILLTKVLKPVFHLQIIERISMIYTNAGILVIPLVQAILGQEYVIYSCAFMMVQLIFLWTHAAYTMNSSEGIQIHNILHNINVIAIIVGSLLFLCHLRLPPLIDQTIAMTGSMIGPVGMLITGMAIAESSLRDVFMHWRSYIPIMLRLVVYPLLLIAVFAVLGVVGWLADGKNVLMTVYIASITPTAAVVTSMAQLYRQDPTYAAALCVVSTILSIGTMPVLLYVFMMVL
ncbi:MAG: AEC family transporter [Megasphaera sp.]|nr:AEC family transporter [Megasphaera sp.]MCI1248182.1 AEC family transporter [Megasphaera sp.]